ncbi:MAG: 3,5-dihydroxyphenylacetyl-CoA synthase DpgA [Rhodospirillaceae bacterium]
MAEPTRLPRPPRLSAIGTAFPGRRYLQSEIVELFRVTDPKARQFFTNGFIHARNLVLPDPAPDGAIPEETPSALYAKHQHHAVETGSLAVTRALAAAGLTTQDVDYIACVTSTGFLCPSLTAHLVRHLDLPPKVHRLDVVGMGCNAGLNTLQPVSAYCSGHPGSVGLLVCVEVCSAAYVVDEAIGTAVVNSLFGDGAACAVVTSGAEEQGGVALLDYESLMLPDHFDAMRFDFDGRKYAFSINRAIPKVLGAHVDQPVDALLARNGLTRNDIRHWNIHSGGRKVIDAMIKTLGLTRHEVRHTDAVLYDHGNLSSGSFLFSLKRLYEEGVAQPGDPCMLITMGPGSQIECCLGRF